jgi:hypothetical protein
MIKRAKPRISTDEYKRDQNIIRSCFEYLWAIGEERCRKILIDIYGGQVDDDSLYVEYLDDEDTHPEQKIYLMKDYNVSIFYIGYSTSYNGERWYDFGSVDETFEISITIPELAMVVRKFKIMNL